MIDIFYNNKTGDTTRLNHTSISYPWPIKTMDLSTLTYFWIVLIGVIVGRTTTNYFERKKKQIMR
jgi:hypothetical protein